MGQTLPYALNQLTSAELVQFTNTLGIFTNVKSFGAVGDGVTNDTQAFLDAIADTSYTYSAIYIPKGIYLISNVLLLKSNLIMFGDGFQSILKVNTNTNKNAIGCSLTAEVDNFELLNFSIDGNQANQSGTASKTILNGVCLYQDNVNNLKNYRISGLNVFGCKGTGILLGKQYYTNYSKEVSNNRIYGCYNGGVWIDDYCEYISLNNNIIDACAVAGVRIESSNINITGGIIKGASTAYAVHVTVGHNTAKHIISGVTMNHSKGLLLDGVSLVSMTGCQVLASELDGVKLNNSTFCNITGNVISGSSQNTTDTYSEVTLVGSDNNIISLNTLNSYSAIKAKYGINCDANSENNKFAYNMFSGAATADHNIGTGENTFI